MSRPQEVGPEAPESGYLYFGRTRVAFERRAALCPRTLRPFFGAAQWYFNDNAEKDGVKIVASSL